MSFLLSLADLQVYAGVFPIDGGEFPKLEEAIERVSGLLSIVIKC